MIQSCRLLERAQSLKRFLQPRNEDAISRSRLCLIATPTSPTVAYVRRHAVGDVVLDAGLGKDEFRWLPLHEMGAKLVGVPPAQISDRLHE